DKIHDAILGRGDYNDLILPSGSFGLGFHRIFATDVSLIGFGHMCLGGATGYCDIKNRFAIGVTLNKCSSGGLTGEIIRFICSELHLPLPQKYAVPSDNAKPQDDGEGEAKRKLQVPRRDVVNFYFTNFPSEWKMVNRHDLFIEVGEIDNVYVAKKVRKSFNVKDCKVSVMDGQRIMLDFTSMEGYDSTNIFDAERHVEKGNKIDTKE
nr:protein kinase-like domain, beta-lactamase/transpeptidase-like protein [Tanacetum cinerariifolium]